MNAKDLYLLIQRYNLASRGEDVDVVLRIRTDGGTRSIEAMADRLEIHFGTGDGDRPVLIIEGRDP